MLISNWLRRNIKTSGSQRERNSCGLFRILSNLSFSSLLYWRYEGDESSRRVCDNHIVVAFRRWEMSRYQISQCTIYLIARASEAALEIGHI